ncbi:MAG: DUF1127 domain-containing protein [Pseudomonadota bacterium]
MAAYREAFAQSTTETVLAHAAHLLERAAWHHARHRVYRKCLDELRQLDDRDLADLGMNRFALKHIARQSADDYMAR